MTSRYGDAKYALPAPLWMESVTAVHSNFYIPLTEARCGFDGFYVVSMNKLFKKSNHQWYP